MKNMSFVCIKPRVGGNGSAMLNLLIGRKKIMALMSFTILPAWLLMDSIVPKVWPTYKKKNNNQTAKGGMAKCEAGTHFFKYHI